MIFLYNVLAITIAKSVNWNLSNVQDTGHDPYKSDSSLNNHIHVTSENRDDIRPKPVFQFI